jgi:1-phosphatidylinositol-3-phosphate 5-kinase
LGPPASRVTSIARHFDRLSREAERERQKRISMVRGKRARPVGVTKAKVEVFNNLRDAFKDEFDTDSSEADNEEDDQDAEDSADSGGHPRAKPRPSPKQAAAKSPAEPPVTLPLDVQPSTSADSMPGSVDQSPAESAPISAASSVANQSILSDARSEMSFTDRLQIELPSFETSAPLPSIPATPQLSNTDTADEGKVPISGISQMSESEMSSGGGERSSILKTLTGLWAFRAGDFTPLEYPLWVKRVREPCFKLIARSASEHIFADSRVIIRENEPTSIIAFTLSSKTYRDKERHFNLNTKANSKVEAFMPDDSATERGSTWDMVSLDEAVETDDGSSRKEGGTHLKYGKLLIAWRV